MSEKTFYIGIDTSLPRTDRSAICFSRIEKDIAETKTEVLECFTFNEGAFIKVTWDDENNRPKFEIVPQQDICI